MTKRFTDTDKYKKTFMRGLPGAYKLFWDYLYHECNHAGIWHVDFQVAQIYIGKDMPIEQATALRLFNESEERVVVLDGGRKWFIKPFIEFQYKVTLETLNPNNKVHYSVFALLEKEGVCKGLASPMQGAKDKEKDKDKDVVKKGRRETFTPPELPEIEAFAKAQGIPLDAPKFFNHYASKGWMVGRNKMKDWKAAARLAARDWATVRTGGKSPSWM